jgi:superfamily I DNA/RNA helicase
MAGYYFNLPPITQLTISQQAALNETKQIALSGGPGTGKSVVSLWRHISNYQRSRKSLLLTYTTTLAKYLNACCKTQNTDAATNVGRSYKNKPKDSNYWAEIIVDEAQDLPMNYFNDIKSLAKVSYGADDSQILYPDNCSKQSELKSIFDSNIDYVLDKNFRSTQRIMQFAKIVFPDAYIPQSIITGLANNIGELPVMLVSGKNRWIDEERKYEISNNKQNSAVVDIIKQLTADTHNIAILVPWKKDAAYFENIVKNNVTDYSVYYEDESVFPDGCKEIKNIHITTFKSAKGLEFDTAIIPNFDNILNRVPIKVKVKVKDEEGNESEIEKVMCTWNDLYVATTRARSNLYLITNRDMFQLNSVTDKQIL